MKRKTLLTILTSFVFALLLSATAVSIPVQAQSLWSPDSGITASQDNTVYTSTNNGQHKLTYTGDLTGKNTVEADFRYNNQPPSDSAAGNAFFGLQIFNSAQPEDFYIVRMYLNLGVYYADNNPFIIVQKRIPGVRYDELGRSSRFNRSGEGMYAEDTWINFKVVYETDLISVLLDGKLVLQVTGCGTVGNTSINLLTESDKIEIKNLSVSHSTVEVVKWQIDTNWAESKEGDDTVYTTSADSATIWYTGNDVAEYNTIEADIKYKEPSRGDGGINLQVNHTGGTYILNLAPNRQPVNPVIRVFNTNSTSGSPLSRREIKTGFGATTTEDWIHLKMILADNAVLCYVNDVLCYKALNTIGEITWTKAGINNFCTPCSVKNIQLSATEVDFRDFGYVDLEFSSQIAVETMSAENAELSYSEGKMVMQLTKGEASVTSPVIDENPGHKYSMYLPLRNTFLVRMANATEASRVRVSYISDTDGDNNWYSKEFDIIPNSDFTTYYFNVDDLGAKGYLKQFKLEILGANSGTVTVDAITFEREKRLYDYAGDVLSCTADPVKETVTVVGSVDPSYNGKEVIIWQSEPRNYNDSLSYNRLVKLATVTANNGQFTAEFSLYKPGSSQTQLASYFLAEVDGVKVSPSFYIENYQDFNDDPARFTIDVKLEANVLDYGAKGDGFTDDTAAIQAAIDAVSAAGGGRVIVPGDDSEYGKRYVLTHIKLKSNMEFVIEDNAVLWQSQREEELNKTVPIMKNGYNTVSYSQDISIDGLVWCTSYSTIHMPMIFIDRCENVRITGNGTIRMNDAGGEMEDPFYFVGDIGLAVGQESRVKQIPLLTYSSTHVDITDLTIMRSNCWHCYMSFNNDMYVANLKEKEAVNVTADGFTITSCKNLTIDRCFTYTSDDAVGVCTAYEDGRGQFYRPTKPEEDNATENIVIRHSYLFGGFGISWMPWGVAATDAYKQETRNVKIFDCSLGGHKASGTWPDDPFYGWSKTTSYTQTEDNNYCAIKDVLFYNNTYLAGFNLRLNNIALKATNFIVLDDITGTIYSSEQFMNGDFDKQVHKGAGFNDETNYVTGLCYWSERPAENGEVGTELIGTKNAYTVDTKEAIVQNNYAGYIKGDGELFQGLYRTPGRYVFRLNTSLQSGTAVLFVRDAVTGEEIASKELAASDDFTAQAIDFTLTAGTTVQLGVRHAGGDETIVYLDDALLEEGDMTGFYDIVEGETTLIDFETEKGSYTVYSNSTQISDTDGALITADDSEYKVLFNDFDSEGNFEVKVDLLLMNDIVNCGIYLFAHDATNVQDSIYAYNIQVESKVNTEEYCISIFNFKGAFMADSVLAESAKFVPEGQILTLRAVVKYNTLFVFINDEVRPLIYAPISSSAYGQIGLRSHMSVSLFDNFSITYDESGYVARAKTALSEALAEAKTILSDGYTQTTFATLTQAIANGEGVLATDGTRADYENATKVLEEAVQGLIPLADLTQLQELLAQAKAYEAEGYTEESFAGLVQAIASAELLDSESAQSAVDGAVQTLQEAIGGLVEKQQTPVTPPEEDPVPPEDDDPTPPKQESGCGSVLFSGIAATIMALGACAVVFAKRK